MTLIAPHLPPPSLMNSSFVKSPDGALTASVRQTAGRTTLRRTTTLRRLLGVAVLGTSLAGCFKSITEGSENTRYGAISVAGFPAAGGNAIATGNAIFFQAFAVNIPDSRVQSNGCQYSAVDTTQTFSIGQMKAGTSLSMVFGAGAATTQRDMSFDLAGTRYVTDGPTAYKANDSVTVTIPGDAAGFPASSIKLRLAEPLLPPDVTVPTGTEPMAIRWNASPDSTTAIILALRYANPPTSKYANEQIVCALKDDGAEDLPASALGPFNLSPVTMRSLKLTRWRTKAFNPTDRSLLHIVTTIDTLVKLK